MTLVYTSLRAAMFFGAAVLGGIAAAYLEVYALQHVSEQHTPEWHFRSGVAVYGVMAFFGALLFLLGYALGSRKRTGRSSVWLAGGLGLAYPLVITLLSVVAWKREGGLATILPILTFAYVFLAPPVVAWRLGRATGPQFERAG